ncbi:MAG: glycosyltransferase family 4 protein [Deltaproteobacteria bacterium]|nr:glycosyltransferase family 4 protein [Deltaproteobacteria bacterium]MBW2083248.1 glycosyltransferase family 4 protein [Deltaproteobacteria bacterium]
MNSLRIMHIEMGRHMYGGALQVLYLMRGLKENGYHSILACTKESAIAKEASEFGKIYELPVLGEADPRHLVWFLKIIRKERPHIVHVHSRRGADLWGGLAARLTNTKAIITRRVDNPEIPLLARTKYSLFEKVVTISEGIKRILLLEGVPSEKIVCIHSAVDVDKYSGPCNRSWFCQEFLIPPDYKTIGMIAQFIPRKGHQYVVEAIPGTLERCPKTKFLFFGKGPLEDNIKALCKAKGVEQYVVFAGFREDLPRIFPCIDLVIHPATLEGLGVSLLQAAASGVPIIGAKAGGIPEVVDHGVNGLLFEPGDVESIKNYVVDLLLDSAKRRVYARHGREIVARKFSLHIMIKQYIRLYKSLS